MDNRVGSFAVPPASMATFDVLATLVLIPVYDAALVPLARRATGEDRGISQPQRIGVGLALSALAMAYSVLLVADVARGAMATRGQGTRPQKQDPFQKDQDRCTLRVFSSVRGHGKGRTAARAARRYSRSRHSAPIGRGGTWWGQ